MHNSIRLISMLIILLPSCGTDKKTREPAPPLSGFATAYDAAAAVKLPERAPENQPAIHNVFRLSENIISGSEPAGEDGLEQLAAMGVKTILSVDGKTPDAETANRLGMRYVHVPIQYSGVDGDEMDRIVKMFREMEGPVFVHCFHGKHRGPAAAAIGRIVVDGVSREQALAEMRQWCGTSKKYEGLYLAVAQNAIPSMKRTEDYAWDFPASHPFTGFRHLMVEVSRPFDHLESLSRRGWQQDPQHPDIDAVNEAEKLAAFFKEGRNLDEVRAKPEDFQRWMLESMEAGHNLRDFLVRLRAGETGANEKALRAFDEIGELCSQCHSSYRNR